VPNVTCVEAEPSKRLVFQVPGRDPVLRFFISGWTWSYVIEPTNAKACRVTICYRWDWLMGMLGGGTMRHQASNELTETAMALNALTWGWVEEVTGIRPASR